MVKRSSVSIVLGCFVVMCILSISPEVSQTSKYGEWWGTLKETGLQNKELPGDRAPGNSQHNEPKGCTVCTPKLKEQV